MANQEFESAKIKVIGVGGGGCNAVNRMFSDGVQGVEFIVCNTDAQVINASPVKTKLLIGKGISKGLGAGADPNIGEQAALESEKEIADALKDSDLIFIAAGMGGGTGTGAAPIVAQIAKETGALVVAAVSKPFLFEGNKRLQFANEGVKELKKYVDSIIVVSNNRLLDLIGAIPMLESFKEADSILKQAVQTITDLIAVPSLINLDFADVSTVLRGKGNALFGIGIGEGDEKAIIAANKAITSQLLESSIFGAKDCIINVTGGPDCSANDAYDAVDIITQAAGSDLNIIFGFAINKEMTGKIIVSIIATGFDKPMDDSEESNSAYNDFNTKQAPSSFKPNFDRVPEQSPKPVINNDFKPNEVNFNNNDTVAVNPVHVNNIQQDNQQLNQNVQNKNQFTEALSTKFEDTDDDTELPPFLKANF